MDPELARRQKTEGGVEREVLRVARRVLVFSGVLQGSMLGPVLFLIFINILDVQAELVTVLKKFADDIKLGHVVKCENDCHALQETLDKMTEWVDTWGMSFNTKKCMVMHYGQRNEENPYYMAGERLQATKEERDIGVLV
jgi:hypothetical protein